MNLMFAKKSMMLMLALSTATAFAEVYEGSGSRDPVFNGNPPLGPAPGPVAGRPGDGRGPVPGRIGRPGLPDRGDGRGGRDGGDRWGHGGPGWGGGHGGPGWGHRPPPPPPPRPFPNPGPGYPPPGPIYPAPAPGYPGYPGYPSAAMDAFHAQRIAEALYEAFLFRQADPTGFAYATQQIQAQGMAGAINVARQIASSPEYYQNVASRYQPYQIVANIYRVLFNRVPDNGAAYWVNMLAQGQTADVFGGIVSSQEFMNAFLN